MAKYKVKNIHIAHNNKVFKEGSVIELEDKHAEALSKYLDPVIESKKNSKNKPSENNPNDGNSSNPESGTNSPDKNTQTDTNGDTPAGGDK